MSGKRKWEVQRFFAEGVFRLDESVRFPYYRERAMNFDQLRLDTDGGTLAVMNVSVPASLKKSLVDGERVTLYMAKRRFQPMAVVYAIGHEAGGVEDARRIYEEFECEAADEQKRAVVASLLVGVIAIASGLFVSPFCVLLGLLSAPIAHNALTRMTEVRKADAAMRASLDGKGFSGTMMPIGGPEKPLRELTLTPSC